MYIFIGLLLVAGIYLLIIYNKLVRSKALTEEGWSSIDVMLKKRYELIPALVSTIKGYMAHEKDLLENLTKIRAEAYQAKGVQSQANAEGKLNRSLDQIMVAVEAYPELKANENFLKLQQEISKAEEDIERARRYYNGTVRENNTLVESIPSNWVAQLFGFEKFPFFEITRPREREVVNIEI